MALTLSITAKNATFDGLVDSIDIGNGSAGSVKIFDSTNTELASLALSNPAFGPANNGTVPANSVTNDDNVVPGAASTLKWAVRQIQ